MSCIYFSIKYSIGFWCLNFLKFMIYGDIGGDDIFIIDAKRGPMKPLVY